KIVNPEQAAGDKDKEKEISMEAQSQSFEMLARSEESLAKAATMKKNFFTIAALAYAASGVLAGIEFLLETKPSPDSLAHKVANFCAPASAQIDKPKESLYVSYISGKKDLYLDHIFYHNLEQSTDLASFLVNQQSIKETYASPSIE